MSQLLDEGEGVVMLMTGFVQRIGLSGDWQSRSVFRAFAAIIVFLALVLSAQASASAPTQDELVQAGALIPQISFSTFARDIAPRVGVFAFAIISLLSLAFVAGRAWLLRPKAADPALAEWQHAASFWVPGSVLFGAVSGIIIGVLVALFAPVLEVFFGSAKQISSAEFESGIFALVGAVLLAALLQYAYEVFFGWAPYRGKLKEQPYKYRIKEISHRAGVFVGIPAALAVLAISILGTSSSITPDTSVVHRLTVAIYLSIISITFAIMIYWATRLLGWLLEGDLLIFLVILFLLMFYWIYRIKRSLFGGSVSAYEAGSNLSPMRPPQRVDIEESYELQRYRDQRFLWVPVFLLIIGMLILLVLPIIGAMLLVAGTLGILYYLKV
jgi:hypothetical protein